MFIKGRKWKKFRPIFVHSPCLAPLQSIPPPKFFVGSKTTIDPISPNKKSFPFIPAKMTQIDKEIDREQQRIK